MPSLTKIQTGFLEPQGAFELDPGTSSSPGLFFSGNTSTGMFSPSSGVLGFSTGSTQNALSILANGNVGINSSSPNSKLDVNRGSVTGLSDGTVTDIITISETGSQGNTGQRILFKNVQQNWEQGAITALREGVANSFSLAFSSSNNGTNAERLRINSSGNVGIGTTNPSNKLTIIDNNDAQSLGLFRNYTGVGSSGTYIDMGSLTPQGAPFVGARILGYSNSDRTGGGLSFYTKQSQGSYERVSILENGNVGIGTADPGYKLDVHGSAAFTTGVFFHPSGVVKAAINVAQTANQGVNGTAVDDTYQWTSGGKIIWSTDNGVTPNLVLNSTGNVGIATANPGTKLDVYGDIAVNGTFAIRRNNYGYSATYKNVFIGSTDSVSNTVSLCVDTSTISGGNFHGQNQVIIPRQGLLVPNQAGTNFIGVLSKDSNDYIRIGPDSSGGISNGPITVTTSNVGIGTTNPTTKLQLHEGGLRISRTSTYTANVDFSITHVGASNYGSLYLDTSLSTGGFVFRTGGGSEKVTITGAGNVGIGTTNPVAKLDVSGGGISCSGWSNTNSGTAGGLELGWDGSQVVLQSYDRVNNVYKPTIYNASRHSFFTGNVGIGVTNPSKKLDVKIPDTSSGTRYLAHFGGSNHLTGYAIGIGLDPEGYGYRNKIGILAEGISAGWSRGKLHFALNGISDMTEASIADAKMTILESGNVGIGVTNPSEKLTVAGDIRAGGAGRFRFGGSIEGGVRSLGASSGATVFDTGITINASNAGGTMMVLASRNTGAGTATQSAIYMLQFYYDGNNIPAKTLISGTDIMTINKSASNTLTVTCSIGNWSMTAFVCGYNIT